MDWVCTWNFYLKSSNCINYINIINIICNNPTEEKPLTWYILLRGVSVFRHPGTTNYSKWATRER